MKVGSLLGARDQALDPLPREAEHQGPSLMDWEGPQLHGQAGRTEGVRDGGKGEFP